MILYANIVKGERKKASKLDFFKFAKAFFIFPFSDLNFSLEWFRITH